MIKGIKVKLNYVKQRKFELMNKPGKWYAYKLRREREKKMILNLQKGHMILMNDMTTKNINIILNCRRHDISVEKTEECLKKQNLLKIQKK